METYTYTIDQGDSSSTEDVESPRSVVTAARRVSGLGKRRWWRTRWNKNNRVSSNIDEDEKEKDRVLHNQVLRIKLEEMQISEDLIGDYCTSFNNYVSDCDSLGVDNEDDVWFGCSKSFGSVTTVLPASPLGSRRS